MPRIYAAKLRAKHFTFFYGGANIKLFIFKVTDEEMQEHYDNFFEEVFVEPLMNDMLELSKEASND